MEETNKLKHIMNDLSQENEKLKKERDSQSEDLKK